MHPDGYIQLKDRSKDIIISGGENISSIEVEDALYKHPAVAAAAVVAQPDDKWGETPCAFVELKPGAKATADELDRSGAASTSPRTMPAHVVFAEIPKTSHRQDPEIQAARNGEGGLDLSNIPECPSPEGRGKKREALRTHHAAFARCSKCRRSDASHPAKASRKNAVRSSWRSASQSNVAHHSTKARSPSTTGVTRKVARKSRVCSGGSLANP